MAEEDNFIFEPEPIEDDDELNLETDEDWEDEFWDEESSVNN